MLRVHVTGPRSPTSFCDRLGFKPSFLRSQPDTITTTTSWIFYATIYVTLLFVGKGATKDNLFDFQVKCKHFEILNYFAFDTV